MDDDGTAGLRNTILRMSQEAASRDARIAELEAEVARLKDEGAWVMEENLFLRRNAIALAAQGKLHPGFPQEPPTQPPAVETIPTLYLGPVYRPVYHRATPAPVRAAPAPSDAHGQPAAVPAAQTASQRRYASNADALEGITWEEWQAERSEARPNPNRGDPWA